MSKTERIHLRVDPETKALIAKLAEDDGRSISNYILALIAKDAKEKGKL